MAVSAVTIPTPQNSNMDRAMFVWCGTAGSAGDPMSSDAKMNNLLSWCSSKGVNVLFLDIWGYLGGGNWSTAHAQTMQKFIHFAHASGIRVMALAGDTGWGQNQQWVAKNIVQKLAQYQAYNANNATNIEGQFDGVMLDVEYWTVGGYGSGDPIGLCDLMNAMRRVLSMPVGCFATQWLADGTSAALSFAYNGVTQLEGKHLMDNADFVAVGCYSNNATTQSNMFANWFNYASATASQKNLGLWCGSLTDNTGGSDSYWTGAAGALATMETAHTTVSGNSTGAPNTNMSFRGQCINTYASYSLMT